jgi:hypothetical protein
VIERWVETFFVWVLVLLAVLYAIGVWKLLWSVPA